MGIEGHYNLNCRTIISRTSLSCLPHINQTTDGAAWDCQWLYLSKMSPQLSLLAYGSHMDTRKFSCYFLQHTHVILSPNNPWITMIHQAHNACRRISQVSRQHRANQAAGCLAKWDIPYHPSGDLHSCVKAGISWKHLWVSLQQRQSKQSFSVRTDSWQGSIWCQGQLYKPKTDTFSFLQISTFVISWSQHGCKQTNCLSVTSLHFVKIYAIETTWFSITFFSHRPLTLTIITHQFYTAAIIAVSLVTECLIHLSICFPFLTSASEYKPIFPLHECMEPLDDSFI